MASVTWTKRIPRANHLQSETLVEVTEEGVEIDGRFFPPDLVKSLGADHISWICAHPNPAGFCRGRARGWWDANDLEMCHNYTQLARLLEKESVNAV